MAIRFRIGTNGRGQFLADFVDHFGHRRAKRFESHEAAKEFLKRNGVLRNNAARAIEVDPVAGAV